MATDVKLDVNRISLEGDHGVDVIASDLVLEHPTRRKTPAGMRRALVHGFNDDLIINFAGDYPGGVVIQGEVKLLDKLVGNPYFIATDLLLDHPGRRRADAKPNSLRRALVHDFEDGLTINWGRDYPGGVTIQGEVKMPHKLAANRIEFTMEEWQRVELPSGRPGLLTPVRKPVELEHVIVELRSEIQALKARLETLEKPT